jgi:SAM-dependent methyltransferase
VHHELVRMLRCPDTGKALTVEGDALVGVRGRRFPLVDGVACLLPGDLEPLLDPAEMAPTFELASLALERPGEVPARIAALGDDYVDQQVAATCGYLYRSLLGRVAKLPIPSIPLARVGATGAGPVLLDIGCGWGRWSIAAARAGYRVIGIDPKLEAVLAARKAARRCGVECTFVCADARRLPFADASFDVVWSYSVLQHFDGAALEEVLAQVRRVVKPSGYFKTQMMNRHGLRSRWNLSRLRAQRTARAFDPPYWSVGELRRLGERLIGPTRVTVDQFFTQARISDLGMLGRKAQAVLLGSYALSVLARAMPGAARLSDNVFVTSVPGQGVEQRPATPDRPEVVVTSAAQGAHAAPAASVPGAGAPAARSL